MRIPPDRGQRYLARACDATQTDANVVTANTMEMQQFMRRISQFCLVVVALAGWSGCAPKQGPVHGVGDKADLAGGTGGGRRGWSRQRTSPHLPGRGRA